MAGNSIIGFLQLRWIGRERIVGYSIILAFVSLLSFGWPYSAAMGKIGSDFLAFWSAGRLVDTGAASTVYDIRATFAVQALVGRHDVFAFVNPPPFLFAVAPFGLLSYPVAWALWIVVTYAIWFLVSRRLDRRLSWPIAAFPGALVAGWHAQTGLLLSAFQAGAALLLRKRPFAAGLCVGALIVKPHLAILFPFAFAAGRHWKAFAGAAVSVVGLLLASWLVFGTQTMINYRESWAVSSHLMKTKDVEFFLRQASVYAAFRAAGFPVMAIVAQALASTLAIGLTWKVWSRDVSMEGKLAFLMALTPLATPYLFNYDLPFLIIPVLWLIREAQAAGEDGWRRPILLFFYFSPMLGRAFAMPLGLNITPWVQCWMAWEIGKRLCTDATKIGDGCALEC